MVLYVVWGLGVRLKWMRRKADEMFGTTNISIALAIDNTRFTVGGWQTGNYVVMGLAGGWIGRVYGVL